MSLKATLIDIADAIREKTGETERILLTDFATKIRNISGGAEFNVAYGDTAPTDTSKIWCKFTEPSKITMNNDLVYSLESSKSEVTTGISFSSLPTFVRVGNKLVFFSCTTTILDLETGVFSTVTGLTIGYLPICAAIGSDLYVFGTRQTYSTSTTLKIIHTDTNTYDEVTSVTFTPNDDYYATSVGTNIYIFGNNQVVKIFDTLTNTFNNTSAGCGYDMGSGSIAIPYDTKIYLFGYATKIRVFDTVTNTFEANITDVFTETETQTEYRLGFQQGNIVYLMHKGSYKVYTFNLDTHALTEIKTMNFAPSGYFSMILHNNKFYVMDGSIGSNITANILYTIEATTPLNSGEAIFLPNFSNVADMKLFNIDTLSYTIRGLKCYVGSESNVATEAESYYYNTATSEWELTY